MEEFLPGPEDDYMNLDEAAQEPQQEEYPEPGGLYMNHESDDSSSSDESDESSDDSMGPGRNVKVYSRIDLCQVKAALLSIGSLL